MRREHRKPEQERICTLLRDTIMALCRSGLPYDTQFCVEGLLGITLDESDIFLVNIKETVQSEQQKQSYGSTDNPDQKTASRDAKEVEETETPSDRGSPPSGCSKKRETTRTKSSESSADLYIIDDDDDNTRNKNTRMTTPTKHIQSPSRRSKEQEQTHSPSDRHHRGLNRPSQESPNRTPQYKSQPKQASARDGSHAGNVESARKRLSNVDSSNMRGPRDEKRQRGDSEEVIHIKDEEPAGLNHHVHIETVVGNVSAPQATVFTGPTGSRPLAQSRVGGLLHLVHGQEYNRGSFQQHGRLYPPMVRPQLAPNSSNQVLAPYTRGSDIHTWQSQNTSSQLAQFKSIDHHNLQSSTSNRDSSLVIVDEDELSLATGTHQFAVPFDLEHSVLCTAGSFVPVRVVRRKSQKYTAEQIVQAMIQMTRSRQDKRYVGEFKCVKSSVKIFYKCPPELISDEALQSYGINRADYEQSYLQSARPSSSAPLSWNAYLSSVLYMSPFESSMANLPEFQGLQRQAVSSAAGSWQQLAELVQSPENLSQLEQAAAESRTSENSNTQIQTTEYGVQPITGLEHLVQMSDKFEKSTADSLDTQEQTVGQTELSVRDSTGMEQSELPDTDSLSLGRSELSTNENSSQITDLPMPLGDEEKVISNEPELPVETGQYVAHSETVPAENVSSAGEDQLGSSVPVSPKTE